MSDRYQGSAYRARVNAPPRADRYASRHPRDDAGYPPARAYGDPRDAYPPSYYPEPRGARYAADHPPRRVHKTVPPPRPWDYSRRPEPRTEQERIALERERESWEAKEEERYQQRMAERERERERDQQRRQHAPRHGGWDRDYDADDRMYRHQDAYDRDRPPHPADYPPFEPRRPRSRSPGPDHRYDQRASWGRASVGSSEGKERELDRFGGGAPLPADRPEPTRYPEDSSYPPRRSPPAQAALHLDMPDGPRGTPRGPASRPADTGFISTPPTGPRASRGVAPLPSSGFRAREGSGSTGPYTPGSEIDSYLSPSSARPGRSARDGPPAPGSYRGGHPSFGRGRRETNPYDSNFGSADDDYRGYGAHAGSSPHEASPFSPSTSTAGVSHLAATAPRLSRTSSSQTPATGAPGTATVLPTGPSAGMASPSTVAPPTPLATSVSYFSAAHKLCPELDAELQSLEASRTAFIQNFVLGPKRTAIRTARIELKDAELDHATAANRRIAAERALDIARETADAYSLEENRKEELQRLLAQQMQQQQQQQHTTAQTV